MNCHPFQDPSHLPRMSKPLESQKTLEPLPCKAYNFQTMGDQFNRVELLESTRLNLQPLGD